MSRRGSVLFAAMCVIWGVPYLMIKVAVGELSPAFLVLCRTGIGALILVPIALARGELRGLRAVALPLFIYSVVEICGPWLLLGFAEQRLTSSTTGLLIAAVPMVGAVIARLTGAQERLGPRRTIGLVIGLAGVSALLGLDLGAVDPAAVAALAVVAVGYAAGPVILHTSLSHLPGLGVVAASLVISAGLYLPAAAQVPDRLPSPAVLGSVLGLAVVCTAAAFVLFFMLIAEVGPARATVITYVNPAVAVLLGVLVLGEPLTPAIGVGFVLVLAGSVLATSGARRAEPVAVPRQPERDPAAVPGGSSMPA